MNPILIIKLCIILICLSCNSKSEKPFSAKRQHNQIEKPLYEYVNTNTIKKTTKRNTGGIIDLPSEKPTIKTESTKPALYYLDKDSSSKKYTPRLRVIENKE